MKPTYLGLATVIGIALPVAAAEVPENIDREAGAGRLCTTTTSLNVRDAPSLEGRVLHAYDPGAIMAYVGDAPGGEFAYVSPCRACDSGYVEKAELLAKSDCDR